MSFNVFILFFSLYVSNKCVLGVHYTRIFNFKNNPTKIGYGYILRKFWTKESQMAEKQLRRCSTPLAITETQIKTTLQLHPTPLRMAKIKSTRYSSCWRRWGARRTLFQWWWECKLLQPFGSCCTKEYSWVIGIRIKWFRITVTDESW